MTSPAPFALDLGEIAGLPHGILPELDSTQPARLQDPRSDAWLRRQIFRWLRNRTDCHVPMTESEVAGALGHPDAEPGARAAIEAGAQAVRIQLSAAARQDLLDLVHWLGSIEAHTDGGDLDGELADEARAEAEKTLRGLVRTSVPHAQNARREWYRRVFRWGEASEARKQVEETRSRGIRIEVPSHQMVWRELAAAELPAVGHKLANCLAGGIYDAAVAAGQQKVFALFRNADDAPGAALAAARMAKIGELADRTNLRFEEAEEDPALDPGVAASALRELIRRTDAVSNALEHGVYRGAWLADMERVPLAPDADMLIGQDERDRDIVIVVRHTTYHDGTLGPRAPSALDAIRPAHGWEAHVVAEGRSDGMIQVSPINLGKASKSVAGLQNAISTLNERFFGRIYPDQHWVTRAQGNTALRLSGVCGAVALDTETGRLQWSAEAVSEASGLRLHVWSDKAIILEDIATGQICDRNLNPEFYHHLERLDGSRLADFLNEIETVFKGRVGIHSRLDNDGRLAVRFLSHTWYPTHPVIQLGDGRWISLEDAPSMLGESVHMGGERWSKFKLHSTLSLSSGEWPFKVEDPWLARHTRMSVKPVSLLRAEDDGEILIEVSIEQEDHLGMMLGCPRGSMTVSRLQRLFDLRLGLIEEGYLYREGDIALCDDLTDWARYIGKTPLSRALRRHGDGYVSFYAGDIDRLLVATEGGEILLDFNLDSRSPDDLRHFGPKHESAAWHGESPGYRYAEAFTSAAKFHHLPFEESDTERLPLWLSSAGVAFDERGNAVRSTSSRVPQQEFVDHQNVVWTLGRHFDRAWHSDGIIEWVPNFRDGVELRPLRMLSGRPRPHLVSDDRHLVLRPAIDEDGAEVLVLDEESSGQTALSAPPSKRLLREVLEFIEAHTGLRPSTDLAERSSYRALSLPSPL